ncbi:MAG: 4-alpha-glucanotransferase [Chloroflexi bacterium]|nr:4-alpha-glucanotransferase [Chloroflexota bacterium]
MKFPRRSGVLLHPISLPGRFGIGDLGDAAYRFIDFLQSAGQSYWQVLPLNPTGYADSPYLCFSALAGNPLLINPDKLVEAGYLAPSDIDNVPAFPIDRVDYGWVIQSKTDLLNRAFENFKRNASDEQRTAFNRFTNEQAVWLDDFALFMALKEEHHLKPWYEWDYKLQRREETTIADARERLGDRIENQKFRQWQFFEQWLAVKKYANDRGIRLIGDIPIFVAYDSAEVWANPQLFYLNKDLKPAIVSGVPPDYFSETGQLWGHPHYRWNVMAKDGYAWWIERFKMAFTQADVVRIDHFRGFYNYWEVPAGEKTAIKGRWVKGPGARFFRAVTAAMGQVAIIAEDLGDFDAESRAGVDALQEEFGYPGMKVIQFAFGNGPADPFLPHNYKREFIAYTGTHDNDTALGWYQETSTEKERDYARRYLARDGTDIGWDLIRLAWSSVAHTAMTTVQDLLNLGHSSRMNTPSTVGAPNWCWRMLPNALNDGIAARLKEITYLYGRLPE